MDQTKLHVPRLYNTTLIENKKDEIEEVITFEVYFLKVTNSHYLLLH